jgi:hypothetical protein
MSSTRHVFEIPAGSVVTIPGLPGSSPKTVDAVDHLRHIAKVAGTSPTFRPPDTWEVVVPPSGDVPFELGARELMDAFDKSKTPY